MTERFIAAGVILSPDLRKVFIAQRNPKADQGALWEFPGGKVEIGETPEQALIRELDEEIGIQATKIERFMQFTHDYGDKVLNFTFFMVFDYKGNPHGRESQPTKWINIEELVNYPFPVANLPVIEKVLKLFTGSFV